MVWVLDLRLRICIENNFVEYGTKYCMSTMTTKELGNNLTPYLDTVVNNAKPRIKLRFSPVRGISHDLLFFHPGLLEVELKQVFLSLLVRPYTVNNHLQAADNTVELKTGFPVSACPPLCGQQPPANSEQRY